MRVAWCTPIDAGSAVSAASLALAAIAAERWDVDLFVTGAADPRPTGLPVRDLAEAPPRFDGYRHCVYHYAARADLHGPIHVAACTRPGIVVLHERELHALFAAIWAAPDPLRYVERMDAWYGFAGAAAAEAALAGERPPVADTPADRARFPLWEETLTVAEALVVYPAGLSGEVRRRWRGPLLDLSAAPAHPGDALAECLDAAERERPWLALADRAGAELGGLGITQRFDVIDRVGAEIVHFRDGAA